MGGRKTRQQLDEERRLLGLQAVEDVFSGRASLVAGVWRMTDGSRAPWHRVALKSWKSVDHILLYEHCRRASDVASALRQAEHDLSWNYNRVCDGCSELHYVKDVKDGRKMVHVPHVVDGVDLGVHFFHISRADWDAKCERYLELRDELGCMVETRDAFIRGVAERHHFPVEILKSGDEDFSVQVARSLVDLDSGSPEYEPGVPLTVAKLSEVESGFAATIKRDEDGLAGRLKFDFCTREQREESLQWTVPRLALVRWIAANCADKLVKDN